MKVMHRVVQMVASVALLAISMPVHASKMDDRIESSARNSYVFKTYLQTDDITHPIREWRRDLNGNGLR